MQFIAGQGVLGRIQFKDGQMPEYDRTYLVILTGADYIELLNVSTIKGKERKLFFPFNERLKTYRPPFLYPSFVKLDFLIHVPLADCSGLKILHSGQTLSPAELTRIIQLLP